MKLRTLIIDDEPVARRVLREELGQLDNVVVVAEADDGPSAVRSINEHFPDLVFLDLQMPLFGGFEVIRRLNPTGAIPLIIIVTAFDEHAIEAFQAGAIDYLLKPVGRGRLAQAVDRVIKMHARPGAVAQQFASISEMAGHSVRRIVAKNGGEYLLLNTSEVMAFEADGDLVWIVTAKKSFLAAESLKVIQEKLRNTGFRRIHRNALVNLDHVHRMSKLSSQRWLIALDNNREFIVSKRQAHTVRQLLSL